MSGNGKVVVGFAHGDRIHPQFRRSLTMALMRDAATKRRIVAELDHEASGVHVPDARCDIVKRFLEHSQRPEWLWMVDTDATFGDDILERLLSSAHPKGKPIVGALAFGVRPVKDENGVEVFNAVGAGLLELFPPLYFMGEDGEMRQAWTYPRDTVLQVHSTGAHCIVIHRTVLADDRWLADGHPLPWYRTAVMGGKKVSEDQFFCLKAGSFGYPVHVDTGAKTGHVKQFIADEDAYLAQIGSGNGLRDA